MKKVLVCFALVCAMIFAIFTAVYAQVRETLPWVSAFEASGNGLIALSDGQLYCGVYEEDGQEWGFEAYLGITMPVKAFTLLEDGAVAVIPETGDGIYTLKQGEVVGQDDWKGIKAKFLNGDIALNVLSFAADAGHFYVLFGNEYQLDQSYLMQLDRQTKEVQYKKMENLRAIKSNGTDTLLLYFYNPYDMQSRPTLARMNARDWKVEVLYEADQVFGGVAVSEDGALYFAQQGELKRMEGNGRPETVAYTRGSWDSTQGDVFYAAYDDGQYLYINAQRALEHERVRPVNGTRVLRIAGGGRDDAYAQFIQKYPDVHVVVDIPELDATQIQLAVTADLDRADIFVVDIYSGYRELRDKGYIAPLDSQTLSSFVSGMYPALRQVLMSDEELVAIPAYFCMMPWAVNETLWKDILGDRAYPATYAQLLDLLEDWPEVYAETYPDVSPIEFGGSNAKLLQLLVQQYILQQAHAQEAIAFDDPQLTGLFERVLELDREAVESDAQEDEFIAQKKLISFSPLCDYGICYEGEDRIVPILPPVLHSGEQATIPVQMRVYVLNPLSDVKDLAVAYLCEVVASYPVVMKASMLEGWNQTHLSAWAQREMDRLVARRQELEEAMADNPDSEQLRMEFYQCEDAMNEIERYGYDVSRESIELYDTLAAYMDIPLNSPYWGEENAAMKQLNEIVLRMAEEQTDLNQAVREMNRISDMIFEEGI